TGLLCTQDSADYLPRTRRTSRRFQLRARLGPSWRIGDSPLTDPTVQISCSGFVKRIHHLTTTFPVAGAPRAGDLRILLPQPGYSSVGRATDLIICWPQVRLPLSARCVNSSQPRVNQAGFAPSTRDRFRSLFRVFAAASPCALPETANLKFVPLFGANQSA